MVEGSEIFMKADRSQIQEWERNIMTFKRMYARIELSDNP